MLPDDRSDPASRADTASSPFCGHNDHNARGGSTIRGRANEIDAAHDRIHAAGADHFLVNADHVNWGDVTAFANHIVLLTRIAGAVFHGGEHAQSRVTGRAQFGRASR